jgi:hypothetical protein
MIKQGQACPKCSSEKITSVGDLLRCQECEHYFHPAQQPASTPNLIYPVISPEVPAADRLHRRAENFSFLAACLVFVGIMALFLIEPIGWLPCIIIVGSLLTTAFWIYVAAQIIHIRANTEK